MSGFPHFKGPLPTMAQMLTFEGIYPSAGTIVSHTWKKPKWASMIYVLCFGSGGGGGAGGVASATQSGGGGGGNATNIVAALFSALWFPPLVYVNVPQGGLGGTGTGSGGVQAPSSLSTVQNSQVSGVTLVTSSTGSPPGGNDGIGANGGGANGGIAGPTATNMALGSFGNWWTQPSEGSAGGGTGNTPADLPYASGTGFGGLINPLSGGGGGGGTTSGGVTSSGGGLTGRPAGGGNPGTFLGPERINGGTSTSRVGDSGYAYMGTSNPWLFTGGAGGASNPAGIGGRGGDGAIGCGGGGGGGSSTGSAAGPGGDGGPGLVVIMWW